MRVRTRFGLRAVAFTLGLKAKLGLRQFCVRGLRKVLAPTSMSHTPALVSSLLVIALMYIMEH